MGEKLTRSSGRSASITVDTQNVCFWIFYISIYWGYTHLKKVTFSSGSSHRTLRQEHDWSGYFRACWLKTTYVLECPVTRWPGTQTRKFKSSFACLFLLIRVLTSRKFRVWSVAWSPNGKQIASGGHDKTIKIWDSQSGDCQSTLTQSTRKIAFLKHLHFHYSEHILIKLKFLFEWPVSPAIRQEHDFFLTFLAY